MAVPALRLVKSQAGHLQQCLVGLVGNDHALPGHSEQHLSWLDCSCGHQAPLTLTPGVTALVAPRCRCLHLVLSAINSVTCSQDAERVNFLYLVVLDITSRLPSLQRQVLSAVAASATFA